RQLAAQGEGSLDSLQMLERDLEAALISGQREDVLNAVALLGNLKQVQSTEPLKNLLPTNDRQIEGTLYLALIKLGDYSKLGPTGEFFRFKNSDAAIQNLRVELGRAISNIHSSTVLPQLEHFSESDDQLLRGSAVLALRTIASPTSVPLLIDRLDDSDQDIRYVSVIALALIINKVGDWAPSRQMFDQQENKYVSLWKEWWQNQGKTHYPRRSTTSK